MSGRLAKMRFLCSSIGVMVASTMAVAVSLSSVAAQSSPGKQDVSALPDGPGKAIIRNSCLSCHTVSVIIEKPGHTDDEWSDILSQMLGRGAILSDEDGDTLMQYLSTNFGPGWKGKPLASPASAGRPSGVDPVSSPPTAQTENAAGASSGPTVNVNKASAQELETALGITSDDAELIVHFREQNGNFKTWEQVSSVPGAPAEKVRQNQKRLTF